MIPVASPSIGERERELVLDCVDSGWVSSIGKYVSQFEEDFAKFCGTMHCVSTSNGTTALHLALLAMGIGPGDEVIVPSLTFAASANAVLYVGAKPVFVDVEPSTWCINPALVRESITHRTRVIMPVHLYGHPADMTAICHLAEEHGLKVLEDAAEAHGAEVKGRRVGSFGHASAFSFYGNKIFTTGEGGALTTDDSDLANRMRLLRDHGMDPNRRYWHPEVGYNFRLTNIQAALGVAQLSRSDEILSKKRQLRNNYDHRLKGVQDIVLPPEQSWAKSVFWMYSILLQDEAERNELAIQLKSRGVDSRPFFYPLHWMPPYASEQSLPVTDNLSRRGINLPSSIQLTEDDVDVVCSAIVDSLNEIRG